MVVIRLVRGGARKRPSYKVVVADSSKPRNGRFIESIGYHRLEPQGKQSRFDVNMDRYSYWCSKGAQPSHAVRKLVRLKLAAGKDGTVVMEEPAAPAVAAAAAQTPATEQASVQRAPAPTPAPAASQGEVAGTAEEPPAEADKPAS